MFKIGLICLCWLYPIVAILIKNQDATPLQLPQGHPNDPGHRAWPQDQVRGGGDMRNTQLVNYAVELRSYQLQYDKQGHVDYKN